MRPPISTAGADSPHVVVVPPRKRGRHARLPAVLGVNSLILSITVHVIFGVIVVYVISEHFPGRRINFHAGKSAPALTDVEHQLQVAQRNNAASAPPDFGNIEMAALSPIVLPDVPTPPSGDDLAPTRMSGIDMSNPISRSDSPGLVGYLYDLKQTPDGKPTVMSDNEEERHPGPNAVHPDWAHSAQTQAQLSLLRSFVQTWDFGSLDDHYYKSDQPLELEQCCISQASSAEAPKAFRVRDRVKPGRWIAVYSGDFLPPETGTYRFIGLGDDFLVVRINEKNVLDGSYPIGQLDPSANVEEDVGAGWDNVPLRCGQWFQLQAGVPVDMHLLMGDGPSGKCGFILMIEKKGNTYPKGDYPLFQLGQNPVPDMNLPRWSKKTLKFGDVPQRRGPY